MTDRPLSAAWTGGRRHLLKDPTFGPWARHIGTIRLPVLDEDPFPYLVRSICYQQLAGAAAATIHGRLLATLKQQVTPTRVLRAKEETLRAAGLSRAKLKAIRDLADKIRCGDVDVSNLDQQSNEEIIERLTAVWGIGEWTVQMFLMFRLRRPDIWPTGDLGVRAGYAKIHGLNDYPSAKELAPLGEPYRPWRSAAAWYCYRVLETDLPE